MGDHHGNKITNTKNLKIAFFLNLVFTIIEVIGGFLTNSVAILSDALHDLGDSLSLGAAWYFENLSKKGRSKNFTYGYRRFSLLGALINAVVLIIGCIFILREAIPRIINPEAVHVKGMIILAVLGVIINGAAVLRLKNGTSLNEKVISLHLLEDVLGWIAVLIGAVLIYFYDIPIIDPILSFLIAGFILFNVYKNLRSVVSIIMQSIPANVETKNITDYLASVEGIEDFHDLHIWTMDGEYHILTVHLVTTDDFNKHDSSFLKAKIRRDLHHLGIEHATIEFENSNEDCELK